MLSAAENLARMVYDSEYAGPLSPTIKEIYISRDEYTELLADTESLAYLDLSTPEQLVNKTFFGYDIILVLNREKHIRVVTM